MFLIVYYNKIKNNHKFFYWDLEFSYIDQITVPEKAFFNSLGIYP